MHKKKKKIIYFSRALLHLISLEFPKHVNVESLFFFLCCCFTGRPSPPGTLQHFWCEAAPSAGVQLHQQGCHVPWQVLHICTEDSGRSGAPSEQPGQCLLIGENSERGTSTSEQSKIEKVEIRQVEGNNRNLHISK